MDVSDFSDPVDKEIIAILNHGKKQQKEIIELVDKSSGTVRNHLSYLVDSHNIIRKEENGGVFYYLEEQGGDIIRPKPSADIDKVNLTLHKMSVCLREGSGNKASYQNLGHSHQQPGFMNVASGFHIIASNNYYVLDNQENFGMFFNIFDSVIDRLDDYSKGDSLTHSVDGYRLFFMATNNIYSNWEKGKENEAFHSHMSKRSEQIQSTLSCLPTEIASNISMLLFHIDIREGQKAFIQMVASGDHDREYLLSNAFYTYDAENQIDTLIGDLEDAKKCVDEKEEHRVEELITEIKRRYKRVN